MPHLPGTQAPRLSGAFHNAAEWRFQADLDDVEATKNSVQAPSLRGASHSAAEWSFQADVRSQGDAGDSYHDVVSLAHLSLHTKSEAIKLPTSRPHFDQPPLPALDEAAESEASEESSVKNLFPIEVPVFPSSSRESFDTRSIATSSFTEGGSVVSSIPAFSLLRGFGHLFTSKSCSAKDLHKHASEFDDFISHNWSTSRWVRFLSLAFHYNSTFAAGMSALLAVTITALTIADQLPVFTRRRGGTALDMGLWCSCLLLHAIGCASFSDTMLPA
eukprot:TRINITY_DN5589_c0_g1_i8.p1 TRINITY_DN5589_c0_g1~~TRINITY_DN5589_c0_g1_i8.p1  ORF type:complete len:274 (+),score=33.23 TRINITY_DN5589_c0_g1_i8:47-868(+)